jgi:hypothetical protein
MPDTLGIVATDTAELIFQAIFVQVYKRRLAGTAIIDEITVARARPVYVIDIL